MSRMIERISDNLWQEESKLSSEEIRVILANDLNIDDRHFIWEVFEYCPSSALKIATNNKHRNTGEQIYIQIENRRDKHCIEESVVQFIWELFEWSPEKAFRYLDTFDERAKKFCTNSYRIQAEKELKNSKLWINK